MFDSLKLRQISGLRNMVSWAQLKRRTRLQVKCGNLDRTLWDPAGSWSPYFCSYVVYIRLNSMLCFYLCVYRYDVTRSDLLMEDQGASCGHRSVFVSTCQQHQLPGSSTNQKSLVEKNNSNLTKRRERLKLAKLADRDVQCQGNRKKICKGDKDRQLPQIQWVKYWCHNVECIIQIHLYIDYESWWGTHHILCDRRHQFHS